MISDLFWGQALDTKGCFAHLYATMTKEIYFEYDEGLHCSKRCRHMVCISPRSIRLEPSVRLREGPQKVSDETDVCKLPDEDQGEFCRPSVGCLKSVSYTMNTGDLYNRKKTGLARHISEGRRVKKSMFYIEDAFIYVLVHIKDEEFCSVTYL